MHEEKEYKPTINALGFSNIANFIHGPDPIDLTHMMLQTFGGKQCIIASDSKKCGQPICQLIIYAHKSTTLAYESTP